MCFAGEPEEHPEYGVLAIYLGAAIEGVELETGHYMGQRALDAYLEFFPYRSSVFLPGGTVQRVVEIAYRDEDGVEQTWAAENWEFQPFALASSVRRQEDGAEVPRHSYDRSDRQAWRIRYVAGYGSAAEVPVGLRQAALMLAAEMYIEREAHRTQPGVAAVANPAASILMRAHKVYWPR